MAATKPRKVAAKKAAVKVVSTTDSEEDTTEITPAPAKRIAKKTAVKKPEEDRVGTTVLRYENNVPLDTLHGYYKNARIGNVDAIAVSLRKNGQFKPLVVNVGTKTKRPREILIGNHTWLAMRKLGWHYADIAWVNVNEEQARRMVLADNRTSDDSQYDEGLLLELLKESSSLEGTGFNEFDLNELSKNLEESITQIEKTQPTFNEIVKQVERDSGKSTESADDNDDTSVQQEEFAPGSKQTKPDEEEELSEEEQDATHPDDIENASSKLTGVASLKDANEVTFDGIGYWGIPRLLPDMLMTFDELPEKFDTWLGSYSRKSAKNRDPEQWWLYNWGVDGTHEMFDTSHVIMAFYAFDDYFENWWWTPDVYVGKMLNSRVKYALTPDWSMEHSMSHTEHLWQLYRSRFIARYMQESGIKVIPNIGWCDGDIEFLEKHILATLPKKLPMVAIQMQTIDQTTRNTPGLIDKYKEQVQKVFDVLEPQGALIYCSRLGGALVQELDTGNTQIRLLYSRLEGITQENKKNPRKKKAGI